MKAFLFFLLVSIAISSSALARTVEIISTNEERILIRIVSEAHEWIEVIPSDCSSATYEVVQVNQSTIILRVIEDGKPLWQTVGFVSKAMLPQTAYAMCMTNVGKPQLCAAIYELSKALIEIQGGYSRKGTTYGIPWKADKPAQGSYCSGTVETESFADAADAATIYEIYAERDCMEYINIKVQAQSSETLNTFHNLSCGYK